MPKFPKLKGQAVLGPMAGFTDVAFRAIARKYGASMTWAEMVNATAVVRKNKETLKILRTGIGEKPIAAQLFGTSDELVEAAKMIEHRFDVIDINCGCPARVVTKTGSGAALAKDPKKIASLVNKVASAVNKPVTIKIRSGLTPQTINAVQVAKLAEDAGVAAITVHGRTVSQGYSGMADWKIIQKVKEAVNVPVIGNGDVFSPESFKHKLEESGVDAVMICRGALGNPYIFTQIRDYMKTGTYRSSLENRREQFRAYIKSAKKYKTDFPKIRAHAIQLTKGVLDAAKMRVQVGSCQNIKELIKIIAPEDT
jgi:nifR3 family TIM-barrel protein